MAFVIDWKKKLGYKKDPFQGLKAKPKQLIVAREQEKEKLNLFIIKQSKIALIKGEAGIGKTLLLYWLYEQVHNSMNTIFLKEQNIISSKTLLFNYLFNEFTNIVDKVVKKTAEMSEEQKIRLLLKKLQKRSLLIIDNADKLSVKNQELIELLLEKTSLQVVLSCEKADSLKLKKPDLEITLQGLKEKDFEKLLSKRITLAGGYQIFPFDFEKIKKLTKEAKNNPKKFLQLAKEKAIELSLKVESPPKPKKILLDSETNDSKKKDSWFTIRFEKDKEEKALFIIKGNKDNEIDMIQATKSKDKSNNKSNSKNQTVKTVNNKYLNDKQISEEDDSSQKAEEIQDFLESLAKEVE